MEIDIKIERPEWDPNPKKSKTDNFSWRNCVIVGFPNCDFRWIPTYKQVANILMKLAECEQVNRMLAKSVKNTENESDGVLTAWECHFYNENKAL